MVKKTITKSLIIWGSIAMLLAIGILILLMHHNKHSTQAAAADLGSLYMSEIMVRMEEHFETVIYAKNVEIAHIAQDNIDSSKSDYKDILCQTAQSLEFDYLALYDEDCNYETILGEDAWYRNLPEFIEGVIAGEKTATTGYQTGNGEKYLVFGVPVQYEMKSGRNSAVLLAGFNVKRLYEYIDLERLEQLESHASVGIILTNGSYILDTCMEDTLSFFEHINQFGNFMGMTEKEGVDDIEQAMSSGATFSTTVSIDGQVQHVYGKAAKVPKDWYFVLYMPKGITDDIIEAENQKMMKAFGIAGSMILMCIMAIFILYIRFANRQIKETNLARKEAEQAREDAEIASKAKSVFFSNMSHDIRTPMNAIVGLTTIIENNIKAGNQEKAIESLGKMKYSSDYLRRLIYDVLDMSKIESGTLSVISEAMSLKEAIETVFMIAKAQTVHKSQKLEIDMHDMISDGVKCDRTRLKQILINILGNATKFTSEGGLIRFEIFQQVSPQGEGYVTTTFIIEDNGIGMSEEFAEKMFESFAREENKVRKIEGTGLGLTIVKSLIDMMGGEIRVDTREGIGTKFIITLDLPCANLETIQTQDTAEHIKIEGMKLLLAEDNDINYDIAQALLSANDILVERAENGQVAFEKYSQNPTEWKIILMDLRMPILNGYEAAKKIREFEAESEEELHIPIFALSADVFAEDIEHCKEAGMEGHLSKPIDMNELMRILLSVTV